MPFHLVLHHLERTCWVVVVMVVVVVVVVAGGQVRRSMNVADRANDDTDTDTDIVQIVVVLVVVVETRGFVHHQERGDPRRRQWCCRCDFYDFDYDSDCF